MRTFVQYFFLLSISYALAAGRKPFSLDISGPLSPVKSGSEVSVKIAMTNLSKQEIYIFKNNPACNYGLEVKDSKSELAPETELGRNGCSGMRIMGKNFMLTLKPNESTDEQLNITSLRDMRRPGRYRVKVSRDIPKEIGEGAIVSNIIEVTVTK
jgi:hypothetical protein